MKHVKVFLILSALVLAISACGAFLETERESETLITPPPYVPAINPPEERMDVSDGYEFRDEILNMIRTYEHTGLFVMYGSEHSEINEMVEHVVNEIETTHPLGSYATSNISIVTRATALFTEIDVNIEFKRTQDQINSIINVATIRYLMTELLSVMREHRDEVAFRTSLNLTVEDIRQFIKQIYYDNPRSIIMLPVVAFEAFPAQGNDRIIELRFGHIEPSGVLREYASSLSTSIRNNAGLADGDSDGEILLSLAGNLIASTTFDEASARAISEHGPQNFAATAFGALVRQYAVGEGFAMAFKALSDQLGFDNRVVLGYRDGMVHAWNIVFLAGNFYHIDVAMSAVYGLEFGFLRTDEDFKELLYTWDFDNTVRAAGELRYHDFSGPGDDISNNHGNNSIDNSDNIVNNNNTNENNTNENNANENNTNDSNIIVDSDDDYNDIDDNGGD